MKQEFDKMTIKGQKSAILLVRALLNNPQEFDYIKDTYLKKCHGSWQLKDKLSVMLDTTESRLTKHEKNYLLKQDKLLSKNNIKWVIAGLIVASAAVILGICIGFWIARTGGVI